MFISSHISEAEQCFYIEFSDIRLKADELFSDFCTKSCVLRNTRIGLKLELHVVINHILSLTGLVQNVFCSKSFKRYL